MVGQWTTPFAGLPSVALNGRQAIQALCRKERRPFVTTRAGDHDTPRAHVPGAEGAVPPAA